MLKRIAFVLFVLLTFNNSAFAWKHGVSSIVACANTQISSTPLGTFVPASNNPNGGTSTNLDSTLGWAASNFSSIITTLNFPADCTYTFTVNAFMTANPGVTDQNSISVYVDGRPIQAIGTADSHYWTQLVTNSTPAQGYNFTAQVKAGFHNVAIGFMVTQNLALQNATMGVHGDRLIVTQASTAFLAEPAGSVDPWQYPGSALSYSKTAIGSGATLSSGSTSADTSLQSGASGAFIHYNDGFGEPWTQGTTSNVGTWTQTQNTSPYFDYSGTNPHAFTQMPNPPAIAGGSDAQCAVGQAVNPRYVWYGTDTCSFTAPGTLTIGNGGYWDSYDLNPTADQQPGGAIGSIRVQEVVTDGVIKHTILMGTQYSQMLVSSSSMIGNGWPINTSDYACSTAQNPSLCIGNLPWGSLVVIPPAVNCSGLGLHTAGVILCVALQNYGAQQGINAGNALSPVNSLFAEQNITNSTYVSMMGDMSTDWNTLQSQLRIVTNNTSANFYGSGPPYAKGGGTPRVAQQSGIQQGYAALNPSPPAPLMTKIMATSYNNASGVTVNTTAALNIGDTLVAPLWQSNDVNGVFSTATLALSGGGSPVSCTITQSTANGTNTTTAIAVCPSLTAAYPIGSQFTVVGSFGAGSWSTQLWKPATPITGTIDKTAQNGTNAAGNTFSLSTSILSQSGDLILGVWGGVVGASFTSVTEFINGSSAAQELGDNTFIFAAALGATGTAANYAPTFTPTGGGTTTTSAVVVALKP